MRCTECSLVSAAFVVCVSGSDGGECFGCEVVHASTGCVYVRQVGCTCADHHHGLCPALPRYLHTQSHSVL